MSIKSEAYQVCKILKSSPVRAQIKNLLESFRRTTPEEQASGKSRQEIRMAAQSLGGRFQVFGYLFVDKNKSQLEKISPPLIRASGLTEDERSALIRAHSFIIDLDMRCVSSIVDKLPGKFDLINPYSRFGHDIFRGGSTEDFVSQEDTAGLVDAFQKHPGFEVLLKYSAEIEKLISQANLIKAIDEIERLIIQAGPLKAPEEVSRFGFPIGSPQTIIQRYIATAIGLRASLASLNELIFLAFIKDKLPVINDNNIIQYSGLTANFVGNGLIILYQLGSDIDTDTLGADFVLIQSSAMISGVNLCQIELIEMSISEELGDTGKIELRTIDDNLNPYSRILDF